MSVLFLSYLGSDLWLDLQLLLHHCLTDPLTQRQPGRDEIFHLHCSVQKIVNLEIFLENFQTYNSYFSTLLFALNSLAKIVANHLMGFFKLNKQ